MNLEKALVACVCVYLAISLPLYVFNQQAARQCQPACEEIGGDIVISAAVFADKIECRCLDSIIRQEKIVSIGNGN